MSDRAPCGHAWAEQDEDVLDGDAHSFNPERQRCLCGNFRSDVGSLESKAVRLRSGMVGTHEGQAAVAHPWHPVSGVARPGLVWLECEVVWSHGTVEGFWGSPNEYDEVLR